MISCSSFCNGEKEYKLEKLLGERILDDLVDDGMHFVVDVDVGLYSFRNDDNGNDDDILPSLMLLLVALKLDTKMTLFTSLATTSKVIDSKNTLWNIVIMQCNAIDVNVNVNVNVMNMNEARSTLYL
mmetsp:Transcript_6923/g.10543  ORF Transcript_6923/g.10543 Transcript_6923/m.10543 type:complete len:127 (-) Transcript_6923:40-420(-)